MGRRTRHTEHMATNERGRPPLPQVNGIQWSEAGNNTLTKWGNAGQQPPANAHVVSRCQDLSEQMRLYQLILR